MKTNMKNNFLKMKKYTSTYNVLDFQMKNFHVFSKNTNLYKSNNHIIIQKSFKAKNLNNNFIEHVSYKKFSEDQREETSNNQEINNYNNNYENKPLHHRDSKLYFYRSKESKFLRDNYTLKNYIGLFEKEIRIILQRNKDFNNKVIHLDKSGKLNGIILQDYLYHVSIY